MTPSQIRGLIDFVQARSPLGVDENGITIEGFLFMNKYLVEQGRIRKVWDILRKFGYNNELRLADDMIPYSSFKRMSDQVKIFTNITQFLIFDHVSDLALSFCRVLSCLMKLLVS